MSLSSVSGKNWILKKYNQENSLFFKENFSLDEITSKLLSRDLRLFKFKAKTRLSDNS